MSDQSATYLRSSGPSTPPLRRCSRPGPARRSCGAGFTATPDGRRRPPRSTSGWGAVRVVMRDPEGRRGLRRHRRVHGSGPTAPARLHLDLGRSGLPERQLIELEFNERDGATTVRVRQQQHLRRRSGAMRSTTAGRPASMRWGGFWRLSRKKRPNVDVTFPRGERRIPGSARPPARPGGRVAACDRGGSRREAPASARRRVPEDYVFQGAGADGAPTRRAAVGAVRARQGLAPSSTA